MQATTYVKSLKILLKSYQKHQSKQLKPPHGATGTENKTN